LQPDERLPADPSAAADPRRVLQRAVALDRAAARAVRALDQGPLGRRPHVRPADPDDRLDVRAAGDDALDRRPRAEAHLHGDAAALGILPEGHAFGTRALLALFERADDPAADADQQDRERR